MLKQSSIDDEGLLGNIDSSPKKTILRSVGFHTVLLISTKSNSDIHCKGNCCSTKFSFSFCNLQVCAVVLFVGALNYFHLHAILRFY
jgi:hypothetical protein